MAPGKSLGRLLVDAVSVLESPSIASRIRTPPGLIPPLARLLAGKVVIDPTNPIGFDDKGQIIRTLPETQSAGSVVAGLLPAEAHYVKAFGTLAADALAASANREPRRAVLFYATDDDIAATTADRLIQAAGFDSLRAGGAKDAARIEAPGGDLHQFGLNGQLVDLDQARAAVKSA